jgi:hypothetical protein
LNRFGDLSGLNFFGACDVGNGAAAEQSIAQLGNLD